MIFLIEYDRPTGTVVTFRRFNDDQRQSAEHARLNLELELLRGRIAHEVVVLEAADEEALRRTHRRYFENIKEMLGSGADSGV